MDERYNIQKKRMVRKYVLICLCIVPMLRPCIVMSAYVIEQEEYYEIGNGNTYKFAELLSEYKENSNAYKLDMLNHRIQSLAGKISYENYSDIRSQQLVMLEKIEELKNAKKTLLAYKKLLESQAAAVVTGSAVTIDTTNDNQELIREIDIQIANIDLQLLQYNSSKSSLEINLSDARLLKDISEFYVDYQSLIEREAGKKLENDFLKQCYSLIIYNEQLDAYKAYQEYLNVIKEIDVIRYGCGLITQIELDTDETNILNNRKIIDENKHLYEAVIRSIKKDAGVDDEIKLKLPLTNDKKDYHIETTVQEFINNNSSYQQIQNYIRSYQKHYNQGHVGSYTSYQQTELQIDYYKLQKEAWEEDIRAYVIDAVHSYKKAFQTREAASKELQIKTSRYNTVLTKYKYKRASRLEVVESFYEKESAKTVYYQSCYEIIIWQDILDNHIYGATL